MIKMNFKNITNIYTDNQKLPNDTIMSVYINIKTGQLISLYVDNTDNNQPISYHGENVIYNLCIIDKVMTYSDLKEYLTLNMCQLICNEKLGNYRFKWIPDFESYRVRKYY